MVPFEHAPDTSLAQAELCVLMLRTWECKWHMVVLDQSAMPHVGVALIPVVHLCT